MSMRKELRIWAGVGAVCAVADAGIIWLLFALAIPREDE